jgi:hypothetical protein
MRLPVSGLVPVLSLGLAGDFKHAANGGQLTASFV